MSNFHTRYTSLSNLMVKNKLVLLLFDFVPRKGIPLLLFGTSQNGLLDSMKEHKLEPSMPLILFPWLFVSLH